MADSYTTKKINELATVTSADDSDIMMVGKTSTGTTSAITKANFLKEITSMLTSQESDIAQNASNIKQNASDISSLNSALAELPSMVQFGRTGTLSVAAGAITEYDVTFPKAFSSTPQVFITCYSTTTASTFGSNSWMVYGISTTGFTIRVANNESAGRSPSFNWLAIG